MCFIIWICIKFLKTFLLYCLWRMFLWVRLRPRLKNTKSNDFLWFPLIFSDFHCFVCVFQSKKSPLTTECTRNLLICFLWVIKNADESVVRQWWSELNVNVLAQILDVLYFCISNFEYKVSPHSLFISQMSVIQG